MLDNGKMAKIDQGQAFLIEYLPKTWYGIYKNCIREGFTEEQTMSLLKSYVASLAKV